MLYGECFVVFVELAFKRQIGNIQAKEALASSYWRKKNSAFQTRCCYECKQQQKHLSPVGCDWGETIMPQHQRSGYSWFSLVLFESVLEKEMCTGRIPPHGILFVNSGSV